MIKEPGFGVDLQAAPGDVKVNYKLAAITSKRSWPSCTVTNASTHTQTSGLGLNNGLPKNETDTDHELNSKQKLKAKVLIGAISFCYTMR